MTHQEVQLPAATSPQDSEIRIITREVAQRVLNTIDHGLSEGLGEPVLGKMCVEAAVCYALELPHDGDPLCVAEALRQFKIHLNDSKWSSPQARARGLRRLGLAQLSSRGVLDEHDFIRRLIGLAITKYVPGAIRAAASLHENPTHQAALNAAAMTCEREGTGDSCEEARIIIRAANPSDDSLLGVMTTTAWRAVTRAIDASYFDEPAVEDDSDDYESEDDGDPTDPLSLAAHDIVLCFRKIAEIATLVQSGPAQASGRSNGTSIDKTLADCAEDVVQILVQMQAPGCQWLDLTEPT